MVELKLLYRAYTHFDETGAHIDFHRFVVIDQTPCFYRVVPESLSWLADRPSDWAKKKIKKRSRLVRIGAARPYCHETPAAALNDLVRRQRQVSLRARTSAEIADLVLAKAGEFAGENEIKRPLSIQLGEFPSLEKWRFD